MTWRSLPRAPAPGSAVMPSEALPRGAARSVVIGGFGLLVLRGAAGLRAYVNACPHQYLPLDYRGGQVLGGDGTRLTCSNHHAVFDAATGAGLAGFGAGCALVPVPLEEAGGHIRIAPED